VSTANIISFLRDRAKFYFKNYYDMPLINAVFSHNLELDLLQTVQDLQFLKDFLLTQNGCDLLNAYKRICNILVIVKKSDNIRAELFNSEYEQNLFEHLVVAEKKLSMQHANLSFGLSALVSLVKPIEIFFDNILVNDSNILIADNRHALLGHVKKLFDAILKFEHL
jgi:glycyl-tRNA synthetase beta chain